MVTRRRFSQELKLEAVQLVKGRGVSVAQAARDLGVHENVLRKWVKQLPAEAQGDPAGRAGRRVRLHREVLQSDSTPFDHRLRSSGCV